MSRRLRVLVCAVLLAAAPLATAADFSWAQSTDGNALLPARQAFEMQPATWVNGEVRLDWNVAPGYYLYRDRIHVHPVKPGAATGHLKLPPAQVHEDQFFGKVGIYRGHFEALYVPASSTPPQQLEVVVQGCADKGVCYPPLTRIVPIAQVSVAAH